MTGTLEIVPTFRRLHAAEHRDDVVQRHAAERAVQLSRRWGRRGRCDPSKPRGHEIPTVSSGAERSSQRETMGRVRRIARETSFGYGAGNRFSGRIVRVRCLQLKVPVAEETPSSLGGGSGGVVVIVLRAARMSEARTITAPSRVLLQPVEEGCCSARRFEAAWSALSAWLSSRANATREANRKVVQCTELSGGRYWTRTSDLVRVKHAL
jgi:hypothetical protein